MKRRWKSFFKSAQRRLDGGICAKNESIHDSTEAIRLGSQNHADEKMKEVSFIIFTVWIFIRYQRKNEVFIWMDCAKHVVKYVNLDHENPGPYTETKESAAGMGRRTSLTGKEERKAAMLSKIGLL